MDMLLCVVSSADTASLTTDYLSWFLLTFFVSLALSIYLVPVMIEAARKYNIVDKPDGGLKNHTEPTPYLGGLAIYIAFVVTLGLLLQEFNDNIVLGVLLAGSMILILGLIDDFGALTPFIKLLGQILAAVILYKSGIRIEIGVLWDEANLLLTVLWIVGICNAFNIIDVMDGLAGGVAVISGFALFFMVVVKGNNSVIAVMTLALTGSILGFLRFNTKPAKIYMGDTGSMFIGLMLGSLSMMVSYGHANPITFLAPLFILGVPIFDTLFVMLLRFKKGLPVFKGSPDHFALKLRRWNNSTSRTVVISYIATFVFCIGGVFLIYLPGFLWPCVLIGIYVVGGLISAVLLARID